MKIFNYRSNDSWKYAIGQIKYWIFDYRSNDSRQYSIIGQIIVENIE